MKITNIAMLEINSFLSQYEDKKFPQKITFAIMKNLSLLAKEQQLYQDALKKILQKYEEYFEKDEEGQNKTLENGLPVISKDHEKDFYEEINELLIIENEVNFYYVDKQVFEYEDVNGKYDVLSAKEMFLLMSVLCKPEEVEEKEAE